MIASALSRQTYHTSSASHAASTLGLAGALPAARPGLPTGSFAGRALLRSTGSTWPSASASVSSSTGPNVAVVHVHSLWYSTARDSELKKYKPVTPGLRGRIITSRKDLWKGGPFKPLTEGLTKSGGRNNHGRVTSRHRGGGHKRVYRKIDFSRRVEHDGVVQRIEYDPNRSARIALLHHASMPEGTPVSKIHSYVLAPQDVVRGQTLASGEGAPVRPGNSLPLRSIPIGMQIHNIEMQPGRGGQLARAAGTSCTLVKKGTDGYATIKLPSGEQKLVLLECMATIGVLSNPQHKNRKLGKAGASRWLGRRPAVRGVAMNAVDHPHGGGRGKSKGRISQSPWGKPTKGYKTRNNKRTDWTIVKRR